MLMDVVAAQVVGPHTAHLTLEDEVADEGDLTQLVRSRGALLTLADPDIFTVRLRAKTGTVTWPNGADLDPSNGGEVMRPSQKKGSTALASSEIAVSYLTIRKQSRADRSLRSVSPT